MGAPFRIGIVGAGYMAIEHARAFASWPDAQIVGVVGRSPERAAALAGTYDCPVYADIAALRNDGGCDAVVVAVPELACRDVVLEVARHDWISLLEKPVGLHFQEAGAILSAVTEAGHEAYVALNRRYFSASQQALAMLDADAGPRQIVVTDTQDQRVARDVGQPQPVIDNWMFANSIHLVDYLRFFGRGDVTNVEVTSAWDAAAPGSVIATVHFSSGDAGLYIGGWNVPGPWAVALTTAARRIELRPLEQAGVQLAGERRLTPLDIGSDDSDYKPGLRLQARQLLDRLSGSTISLSSLADATKSMELVARIYGRL
jgi:predicted dehydrogenase